MVVMSSLLLARNHPPVEPERTEATTVVDAVAVSRETAHKVSVVEAEVTAKRVVMSRDAVAEVEEAADPVVMARTESAEEVAPEMEKVRPERTIAADTKARPEKSSTHWTESLEPVPARRT